ncbi:hypothetical protein SCHPADRAFT_942953 [Schizopora paradoxa]|uniref:Uncharacterized protein n=1 Tax=Schizopora paradoxa TaxID=27342 RepID=A0A0H2RFC8_9AGAM|nr:hypothetical protein SCHPADRAFT_942953 [Schizopora paradoxa]
MPLPFSRRPKRSPQAFNHSNVEVVGLTRIDTVSSIASDATTDNQPGAGRTLGVLYGRLGSELESALNRHAERLGVGSNTLGGPSLSRFETISSIDSNATNGNQPGAGRTVGIFLSWLGSKLERAMNRQAKKSIVLLDMKYCWFANIHIAYRTAG